MLNLFSKRSSMFPGVIHSCLSPSQFVSR